MPESMDVFNHDYHFPNKHTREGTVSHTSRGINKQTKGKVGRGYGGPKSLKPHGSSKGGPQKDSAFGGKSGAGVKETGNEYRSPRDHKDVPTAKMAGGSKAKSTAPTLKAKARKDPTFSGYRP